MKLNTRLYLLLLLLLLLLTAIELSLGGSRPNAEVMSEWRHIHTALRASLRTSALPMPKM
jgi:hypothetical protein